MVWGWSAILDPGQGRGYICRYAAPRLQQERQPCQARQPDETPLARRPASQQGRNPQGCRSPGLASAKAAAAVRFGLDEIQRGRIMVQELG
jgi:hypothetical protein